MDLGYLEFSSSYYLFSKVLQNLYMDENGHLDKMTREQSLHLSKNKERADVKV